MVFAVLLLKTEADPWGVLREGGLTHTFFAKKVIIENALAWLAYKNLWA